MHLPSRLTAILAAAIFLVNIYRAATQSITIDEAFTYEHFTSQSWQTVLTTFDANHHVINTVLAKGTTSAFGLSEFTMRIPSLFGGLLYLLAVRALALSAFRPLWSVIAFALLSLNPFLLDYLSAARGYGMALGFWTLALHLLLRNKLYLAGMCLGFSIGSNLVFAIPSAALAIAVWPRKRWVELLVLPAILIAFIIVIGPLSGADMKQFYFGVNSLHESVSSLINPSLLRIAPPFANGVYWVALALAILTFIAAQIPHGPQLLDWMARTMLICAAAIWLAHRLIGMPYPLSRTAIYWPVLLTLAGVALAERYKHLHHPALVLTGLCLAQFLHEFDVGDYEEWKADANMRSRAHALLQQTGNKPTTIACTRNLSYSLTFYRDVFHAHWQIIPEPAAPADIHVY